MGGVAERSARRGLTLGSEKKEARRVYASWASSLLDAQLRPAKPKK